MITSLETKQSSPESDLFGLTSYHFKYLVSVFTHKVARVFVVNSSAVFLRHLIVNIHKSFTVAN